MARLKAAVIGLGRIASTIDEELDDFDGVEFPYGHIPCYMSMPEVEVVGMSDTWVEQREAAGAKWGFEALYADYRQMLEETRPDIVSVCTSAKPRGDILLEIANGGYGVRAIWAEKPITLSLAEADAAIGACKRANIALAINCTRRWQDDYLQVNALIDDGAIGDVVSVDSRSSCGLSHNGSHLITTLTMYVPERAVSVVGEAELDEANPDNDFSGVGLIRFPGNVRGYVRAYDNGPNESSHDIVGTDGMIRIINDARSIQIWTAYEALEGHRQLRERRSFVRATSRRRCDAIAAESMRSMTSSTASSPGTTRAAAGKTRARHWRSRLPFASPNGAAISRLTCRWRTAAPASSPARSSAANSRAPYCASARRPPKPRRETDSRLCRRLVSGR